MVSITTQCTESVLNLILISVQASKLGSIYKYMILPQNISFQIKCSVHICIYTEHTLNALKNQPRNIL